MKVVANALLSLPFWGQAVIILLLSTVISILRSYWYSISYRKGWYKKHGFGMHLPPALTIAFIGGILLGVSEPLVWLFIVPTAVFFTLFDARNLREMRSKS